MKILEQGSSDVKARRAKEDIALVGTGETTMASWTFLYIANVVIAKRDDATAVRAASQDQLREAFGVY